MLGYLLIVLCILTLYWSSRTALSLQRNIVVAEASGLSYAISREFRQFQP